MTDPNDFASMMEAFGSPQAGRGSKRLRVGETVEGTVVQVTKDYVFVDVGATSEGRIDRGELEDKKGELAVKVGDKLRARVANLSDLDGVKLVTALGRGNGKGALDLSALEAAKSGELPVEGTVQKAVKGGLEVSIGAMRGFCPASQVDTTFVSDLSVYEGKQLSFRVMEIKDGGRSIVLSRRSLLEKEKQREGELVLQRLSIGGDFDGTVQSVQSYGAFVDLGGGVEGLIHISELAHSRIDRVQDVLSVGESVTVRILSMEPNDKGPFPKLRLSLKARIDAPAGPNVEVGEVLAGKVSQVGTAGIFVETPKGTGLVPVRELGLPRGAEFRRAFPVDTEVRVVLMNKDNNGRLTFSIARVAGVEERNNYSEFSKSMTTKAGKASNVGSFGALLATRLGLQVPESGSEESPPESAPLPATVSNTRESHARRPNTDGMVRRQK
jgi:small subunit ribosomal protein S1